MRNSTSNTWSVLSGSDDCCDASVEDLEALAAFSWSSLMRTLVMNAAASAREPPHRCPCCSVKLFFCSVLSTRARQEFLGIRKDRTARTELKGSASVVQELCGYSSITAS